MPNYLTVEYFVGELTIPNITGSSPAATANANNLKWFIAKYEPDFMEKLLGSDLYDEFLAGMPTGDQPITPENQKWVDLQEKIYVISGEIYLSPAANYVYYHHQRDHITATTQMGEIKPKGENNVPTSVSNTMKMVNAWNQMEADCEKLWEWLEENLAIYPSFDPYQENPFGNMNMFNF